MGSRIWVGGTGTWGSLWEIGIGIGIRIGVGVGICLHFMILMNFIFNHLFNNDRYLCQRAFGNLLPGRLITR